ncbi:Na+/H+ antiporter subunit E [Desulfonatronovibrio hydrogenovorans]|uniref:Na+/H+ antiporter subunit E n=1 Tax=Desulfonatronovibrio hydrogenovorans TaxID=53245 RepID=UPI000689D602|nr:Na+/H+ antiporter subunit E [Desulfonatronovibrio hydrogenovorans]
MSQPTTAEQVQSGFFKRFRGIIFQAFLLMALWLILSGHFDLEHIIYGALSVALVVWLNYRVRHIPMSNGDCLSGSCIIVHRLILYLFWLVIQIVKSGTFVAYLTLHPRMPINPMIVRFRSSLPNPLAKVILGNSITLTPGTLTVDIRDDFFTVHALIDDTEEELVSGDMEARVGRLYLDHCTPEQMCTDIAILKSFREAKDQIQIRERK